MWINCVFQNDIDIELRYILDEEFFEIYCVDKYKKFPLARLYVYFENKDFFEIGILKDNIGQIDKKYSINYLKSIYDDLKISHFLLCTDNGKNYEALPQLNEIWENDSSIIRARELLNSAGDLINSPQYIIDGIKNKIKQYEKCKLPILNEFTWYSIYDEKENFKLSSLDYITNGERFRAYLNDGFPWYFGSCNDDRLYAVAVKTSDENPILNAYDCVMKYRDNKHYENFYVLGILLLDDGQYFCRLD